MPFMNQNDTSRDLYGSAVELGDDTKTPFFMNETTKKSNKISEHNQLIMSLN